MSSPVKGVLPTVVFVGVMLIAMLARPDGISTTVMDALISKEVSAESA